MRDRLQAVRQIMHLYEGMTHVALNDLSELGPEL